MGEWSMFRFAKAPAVAAILLLVASNLCTDRWYFTQGVWWIPRLAIALPAVAWLGTMLLIAWRWRRDAEEASRLRLWTAASIVLALLQLFRVWGLPSARPEGALRLVHWNAAYPSDERVGDAVAQLLALDADAYLVTDPGPEVLRAASRLFPEAGYQVEGAGKFALFSRLPVREAQAILAARNRFVSRFRLQCAGAPSGFNGDLVLEAVDLPSAPTLPRTITMRSLAADLAQIRGAPPDIFVGDFNITRGSHSLSMLDGEATEAFAAAGTGWGLSYPRERPFIGIDLALVRLPWRPLRSEILDLGTGRHRAQVVDIGRTR